MTVGTRVTWRYNKQRIEDMQRGTVVRVVDDAIFVKWDHDKWPALCGYRCGEVRELRAGEQS